MNNNVITEFVKIEKLQTATDEQLKAKIKIINQFLVKQDGFLDAELIKPLEGNTWYLIYHIENFEKLKAVGAKLRSNKLFDEINPLIVPGSLDFIFFNQQEKW